MTGSTSPAPTYSDGRIGAACAAISGNASYADKNVGAGKIVTISGITLTERMPATTRCLRRR
jgi:hypothetical protein